MRWTYIVSIVLLALTATPIPDVEGFLLDTNNEPCQYTQSSVTCTSRGHSQVPVFNRSHLSQGLCTGFRIEVNDNQITRVEDNAFVAFQALNCSYTTLSLADNNISYISDQAFRGIEGNITNLNLTGNDLATIPDGVGILYRLRALEILDNPLLTLDPHTMANLGRTLGNLHIDMAHMQQWPTELHLLRGLGILYIANIPFEHLGSSAFHGLSNVEVLTIHHSRLRKMSSAFCEFTNLLKLTLTHNYNFNYSGPELFEHCTNNALYLRIITFTENNVDFFPNTMTMFNRNLVIDARNNNMQYMDISKLQRENTTDILTLQNNIFTRVPTGLFIFEALGDLRLSNNRITYIYDNDLDSLTHLYRLLLDANPIRFITRNAFRDCTQLSTLSLRGTFLSEIPEALTTLSPLRWLDLKDTKIECTCDMAHLKSWNITKIDFESSKCYQTDELLEDFIRGYIDQGHCTT